MIFTGLFPIGSRPTHIIPLSQGQGHGGARVRVGVRIRVRGRTIFERRLRVRVRVRVRVMGTIFNQQGVTLQTVLIGLGFGNF